MDILPHFLRAGPFIAAFMALVWLLSLPLRNTGIVDVFWGPGFIVASLVYADSLGYDSWRTAAVLALVTLWGVRLALHVLLRSWGKGEDKRYAKWRADHERTWWWRSFFTVFLLQGLIMWLVSLPLLGAQLVRREAGFSLLDGIGLTLFVLGFVLEALSDWQLLCFQRDPRNRGKVLDTGLWSWSRHPNYFGEMLIWWGFFCMALVGWHYWAVLSPIVMTVLLMKVSGVTLLERTIANDKPGYADYVRRTSAFFPRPPQR